MQTPRGVTLSLVDDGHADIEGIRQAFHNLLQQSGLADPEVTVQRTESLEKLWSGKVSQFQPLP